MFYVRDFDRDIFNSLMDSMGFSLVDDSRNTPSKSVNDKTATNTMPKSKSKTIGEYTLNEVKAECPFANGKLTTDEMNDEQLVSNICDTCKFNVMCTLTPEEWDEDKLKSDGKKHLTKEECESIKKQIAELTKRLEDNE